jgi:hypothetical protein
MTPQDDVIGTTTFTYKGFRTDIILYKPKKKWEDGDEFSCAFSIIGEHVRYSDEIVGYDSMQAIVLALSMIGYYLQESGNLDTSAVEWPGGVPYFPKFDV